MLYTVFTLYCLATVGITHRLSMNKEHAGVEGYFHSMRNLPKLAHLAAFLLAHSGPAHRNLGLGFHRHGVGASMVLKRSPKIDPELIKLLKGSPESGSAVVPRLGNALEVDGTTLKNDPFDTAMVARQFQSAMYMTARWPQVQDIQEVRDSELGSGFPQNVKELRRVLETTGNNIFNHQGHRLQRTHSDYEEILGKGVSGVVYKRKYSVDGRESVYAVKTIPFNPDVEEQQGQVRMAVKEIQTMVKAADKHMVRLHDVFFMDVWNGTAPASMLHMVMDCGIDTYGTFMEKHGGPAWDDYRYEATLSDMLQMFSAIHAMHEAGIAHRDVKPGNVVYFNSADGDGTELKFIDFGHADGPGVGGSFYSKELRGTPEFVSPEVAENFIRYEELPNMIDGRAMDNWALGIMLYYLLTGDYPFYRGTSGNAIADIEALCEKVIAYKNNYPTSVFTFESSPMAFKARHVINGLLHPNPLLRMSIEEAIRDVRQLLQEALLQHRL